MLFLLKTRKLIEFRSFCRWRKKREKESERKKTESEKKREL